MAKEKHLAVVEVGAVVELAKGLTSSHLIRGDEDDVDCDIDIFLEISLDSFLGYEVQQYNILL